MASGALSGAASGASTGASFGPWGAAIGAVAGAVLGSSQGKSAPATLQGFNVTGQFNRGGFTGTVTAGDQKGDRWTPSGENSYLNSIGRGIVQQTSSSVLSDAEIDDYFNKGGAPIDVSVSAGADNSTLARTVGDSIIASLRGRAASNQLINQLTAQATNMQAPTIGGAQPGGMPATQGGSTVLLPAGASAGLADILNSPVALVAIVAIAYFLMKKAG